MRPMRSPKPSARALPCGRGQRRLARRQPAPPFRPLHLRDERRQAHRLVHVLVVGAIGAVGADAEIDAAVRASRAYRRARLPSRMLLPGLCATEAPRSPSRAMSSSSSQTPCATVKSRAEHAELVEMRGQGLAVELDAGDRLHLRLGDMAVQPDTELARERGAAQDERVGAMVRDGRRDRGAHLVAVEATSRRSAARIAARVASPGARRSAATRSCSGIGQRVEQTGDRLEKGAVGDHRRDDRAHADLRIGRGDEADAVAASAAEIRRRDRSRRCSPSAPSRPRRAAPSDGFRPRRAVAGEPGRGGQQQFERPAVAHALGEIAVRVGVGVDEAGMDQPAVGARSRPRPPARRSRAGRSRGSCRRRSGCRPARRCPCRCRAPGRRGLSCRPSDCLPWQPIRHLCIPQARPSTELGFALALLRMRDIGSWHQRNFLILSASGASSRRTHNLCPALCQERHLIPVPGLRGHPRRESVDAKMWAAGTRHGQRGI